MDSFLQAFGKEQPAPGLVILDELGYVIFDQIGSEILFNLLSNRTTADSTIITTNLSFDRWKETFKDLMLTAAMVDPFSVAFNKIALKSLYLNGLFRKATIVKYTFRTLYYCEIVKKVLLDSIAT